MNMENDNKPHPIVAVLFVVFLVTFFGGGCALFINLFVPFLPEAAFAIIALIIGAMLLVLLAVGTCVQVITALRRPTKTGTLAGVECAEEGIEMDQSEPD